MTSTDIRNIPLESKQEQPVQQQPPIDTTVFYNDKLSSLTLYKVLDTKIFNRRRLVLQVDPKTALLALNKSRDIGFGLYLDEAHSQTDVKFS